MTIPRTRPVVNPITDEFMDTAPIAPPTSEITEEIHKEIKNHENANIRIYVHVTRNPVTRQLQIRSSHPLPTCGTLAPYLNERARQLIHDYGYSNYTIDQFINAGYTTLTPAQWQDAIVKELIARITGPTGDPEPFNANPFSHPAFLTIGGTLYSLHPEEQIKTSGALRGLRKRITAEALALATSIRAKADQYALDKALEADRKLADAKRKLDDIKKSGKIVPPQWAISAGIPTWFSPSTNTWSVCSDLIIKFTSLYYKWEEMGPITTRNGAPYREIVWKWKRWLSQSHDPIKVKIWIPIVDALTGQYNMSGIFLDKLCPALPHISHVQACMAPSMAPAAITAIEHLNALRAAIELCLYEVDYSSPLVKYLYWSDQIRKAWRDPLKAALEHDYWPDKLKALAADDSGTLDPIKESSETWKAA